MSVEPGSRLAFRTGFRTRPFEVRFVFWSGGSVRRTVTVLTVATFHATFLRFFVFFLVLPVSCLGVSEPVHTMYRVG